MPTLNIRAATPNDTDIIMKFVVDLAIYEKAEHEVVATKDHINKTLFADTPQVSALIAELNGKPVGFAVYFFSYSTWLGKHGIYLEDLFVSPESRGSGAGKELLRELSRIAVAQDCGRVEWSVLDWNEPSIKFYEAMGAKPKDGWTVYRLDDQALVDFANS